jgi:hypothetical protein
MSPELRAALAPLLQGAAIQVRQLIEMSKVLVGWDARNQYEVSGLDGRPMGYIGETGEGIAGALLRNFWAFRTVRLELMTLATIRKRWSSLAQEVLTDADNFGVEFEPTLADGPLRQLILAATIGIDLVYFERRGSAG